LFPIIAEIAKTAIENKQSLIIEGVYIPPDYKEYFDSGYLAHIKYVCLIFSRNYTENNFDLIKEKANVIEERLDDTLCRQALIDENLFNLKQCEKLKNNYRLIESEYNVDTDDLFE